MSFFDDASLVFLPSGQAGKDGKAYSMKPVPEYGSELVTNGDFATDSDWQKTNATISGGVATITSTGYAYAAIVQNNVLTIGNTYYATIDVNSIVGGLIVGTSETITNSGIASVTFTATTTYLDIRRDSAFATTTAVIDNVSVREVIVADGDFTFSRGSNLTATRVDSNGLIAKGRENLFLNSDTPATQSITITNGGVYVLSFLGTGSVVASGGASFTLNGTGEFDRVENYFVSSSTSVTLTISGTITEPQLELGLAATEYILSGASSGKAGILEDSPRFDYSGGASCPSLLLEPSRTNEIGYSEYFEGWTPQGSPTITSNFGTSPEGLQNSSRLRYTTDSDYIETSVTNTSGVFTIYAKGTGNLILTDSGANASSTTALTSSYQRIELYFSTNTTTLQIKTDSSGLDAEVYAAQFENATYPTSYIPNHSGGSVTREADVNTLLNQSGVIGQTAGTILFDAYFDEAEKVNFSISDSTSSNFISIETTSSNEVTAKVEQGGSTQATITTSTSFFAEGDRLKCAIAYDDRDMAFYINGTQVNTAAPNLIPACDDVRFGNYDGSIKADQRVNRVLLFDTRISNGNLATLTS